MDAERHRVKIKKVDDALQIVYAEVYAPNLPDSQGDFMVAEEIRKGAHKFLADGLVKNVDRQHNNERTGSAIVESFIARPGDPDFILDSWVVGVHIPDPALWQAVKDGQINAFSFEGFVHSRAKVLEIEVPDEIRSVTKVSGETPHDHKFVVRFNDNGEFVGGEALPGEGDANHPHVIRSASVTEEGGVFDQHTHRYSFLDAIADIQNA